MHTRESKTVRLTPRPVIIIEGTLILSIEDLRNQMDLKVFVDTDTDLRFIRRLERDRLERGRTVESVVEQYLSSVRQMHMTYVEPSRKYADTSISGQLPDDPRIQEVADRIVEFLKDI
jgi:uridine kinase